MLSGAANSEQMCKFDRRGVCSKSLIWVVCLVCRNFACYRLLHGMQFCMVRDFCMQRNSEQTSSFSKKDMLHPSDLSWHCMIQDNAYQF